MNKYLETDVPGLVKDSNSGAILNVDNAKLEAYRKQKRFFEQNKSDSQRITKLEGDIIQIKEMLQQLLKRS